MDNPFGERSASDKFENGVLTTTGCFARHDYSRQEQELNWLARENEIRLDHHTDMENMLCDILSHISGVYRNIDEKTIEYFDRVKTEMM